MSVIYRALRNLERRDASAKHGMLHAALLHLERERKNFSKRFRSHHPSPENSGKTSQPGRRPQPERLTTQNVGDRLFKKLTDMVATFRRSGDTYGLGHGATRWGTEGVLGERIEPFLKKWKTLLHASITESEGAEWLKSFINRANKPRVTTPRPAPTRGSKKKNFWIPMLLVTPLLIIIIGRLLIHAPETPFLTEGGRTFRETSPGGGSGTAGIAWYQARLEEVLYVITREIQTWVSPWGHEESMTGDLVSVALEARPPDIRGPAPQAGVPRTTTGSTLAIEEARRPVAARLGVGGAGQKTSTTLPQHVVQKAPTHAPLPKDVKPTPGSVGSTPQPAEGESATRLASLDERSAVSPASMDERHVTSPASTDRVHDLSSPGPTDRAQVSPLPNGAASPPPGERTVTPIPQREIMPVSQMVAKLGEAIARGDREQMEAWLKALELTKRPNDPYLLNMRAYWHMTQREYPEAEIYLKRVLLQNADDLEAGLNMAIVEANTHRTDDAQQRLQLLSQRYPSESRLQYVLNTLR